MRDIGKNIRELRIKKSMTQDALAESLFVTRQTVSNYETGKSRPDIDMLIRIAEVLDCDINSILYGQSMQDDRKKEIRVFLIGLVACVISGFPLIFWDSAQKMWQRMQTGPKITLHFIVLPLFLLIMGWTLMQGISILTRAKPVKYRYGKIAFWVFVIFAVLYFSSMLPLIYHEIKTGLVREYISGISALKGWSSGFAYGLPVLDKAFGNFWLFMINKQWIFFVVGILMWLFKVPGLRNGAKIALPLCALMLSLLLYLAGDSKFIMLVPNPEEFTNVPYGIQVEQYTEE